MEAMEGCEQIGGRQETGVQQTVFRDTILNSRANSCNMVIETRKHASCSNAFNAFYVNEKVENGKHVPYSNVLKVSHVNKVDVAQVNETDEYDGLEFTNRPNLGETQLLNQSTKIPNGLEPIKAQLLNEKVECGKHV